MNRPAWVGWAIFFIVILAGAMADYYACVDWPMHNSESTPLEVSKGQSLKSVAELLRGKGLIDKPYWVRYLAWMEKSSTRLKYGEYDIPPGTTPRQALALFSSGKVRHYSLKFVEGWNFNQLVDALSHQAALACAVGDRQPTEIMAQLGVQGENPEGRFYPDTYFFVKGDSDLEVLKRAYHKMQTVLADEWQGREPGLPLRSPYEALILASIVEKETGQADERPQIAGVFVRRLASGMLLQTDPTVIYGMGAAYVGNIRKDDLLRDTPYNTYTRSGLPPTPICMPGAAAIHAAVHPAPGTSLYFVARGDGSHVFSTTLAEHNKAVEFYQKKNHD